MGESGAPSKPWASGFRYHWPHPTVSPAGCGVPGLAAEHSGRNHSYSLNTLNRRAFILYSFYLKLPCGLGKELADFLRCAFAG